MDIYEEAQDAAVKAHRLEPGMETWGLESYGDAPGGMGGGVGGFLWFESREELFDFTARLLTYFEPGPESADHEEVASNAARVVAQVESGELNMQEGMEALNRVLVRFSQLRWWGQFKELLEADSSFAKELRAWSRLSEEEEEDTSPISIDELEEFKSSLSGWGV